MFCCDVHWVKWSTVGVPYFLKFTIPRYWFPKHRNMFSVCEQSCRILAIIFTRQSAVCFDVSSRNSSNDQRRWRCFVGKYLLVWKYFRCRTVQAGIHRFDNINNAGPAAETTVLPPTLCRLRQWNTVRSNRRNHINISQPSTEALLQAPISREFGNYFWKRKSP